VALKLLHSDGEGPEHTARLEREARAMAKISHPNVLAVHELGNDQGRRFITMELVDGWTLGDWLSLERRDWRAVLAKFRLAGEGLAAAHAAGLVHRDFKPANVLVSNDGRVRVTDFGLVRMRTEAAPASGAEEGLRLDPAALTLAGSLMGTPRFMSPEQLAGLEATHQSDQFSFCVSLYEALFGVHPFGTESLATMVEGMTRGLPPSPPPGTGVPRSIHQALRRGLQHRPEARWPSMSQLLAELSRDTGLRRRRGVRGVVAVLALVLAVGAAAGWQQRREAECARSAEVIDSVWSPSHREAVLAAFAPLPGPLAKDAATRASRRLDDYRTEWAAARVSVCRAARAGTVEPALLRRQEECLELRRRELAGLAGALRQPTEQIAGRAVTATFALTPVASCSDLSALALRPEAGEGAKIQELAGKLAEATAVQKAVGGSAQLQDVQEIARQARALGSRALEAEALALAGYILSYAGQPVEADKLFKQGILAATASRNHAALPLLWTYLAQSKAVDQGKLEEGLEALEFAEAATLASGDASGKLRNLVLRSLVLWTARKMPEALETAREAVAVGENDHPDGDLFTARINYGGLLLELGRLEEATVQLETALERSEALLGPDHPRNLEALLNLSLVYASQPRRPRFREDAERAARRALELMQRTVGADNLRVADPLMNLGALLAGAGRDAEAEPLLADAIARYETHGIVHRFYRNALTERALALGRLGRHAEAEVQLRKAEELTVRMKWMDGAERAALDQMWGRPGRPARHRRGPAGPGPDAGRLGARGGAGGPRRAEPGSGGGGGRAPVAGAEGVGGGGEGSGQLAGGNPVEAAPAELGFSPRLR